METQKNNFELGSALQAEITLTGNSWIMPANSGFYNHEGAFDKFGYIDWRQGKRSYQVGDIIYLYCTKPISKVRFMALLEQKDMSFSETTDDREFWTNPTEYGKDQTQTYIRLRLLKKKDSEDLSLEALKDNGLRGVPQGAMRVKKLLDDYLKQKFAE